MNFKERGFETGGSVRDDAHVHRSRDGGLETWENVFDPPHRLDHIGARLFVEDQQDGGLAILSPKIANILHRIHHAGDITQTQNLSRVIGQNQLRVFFGRSRLVIGLDLPNPLSIFHQTLGAVAIEGDDRQTHLLGRESHGAQLLWIELDAHRW